MAAMTRLTEDCSGCAPAKLTSSLTLSPDALGSRISYIIETTMMDGYSARQLGTGELVGSKIVRLRRKCIRTGLTLPVQVVCASHTETSNRNSSCSCVNRSGKRETVWRSVGIPLRRVRGFARHAGVCALDANEYMAKLLECRRSNNGVFGLNARFDDFNSVVRCRSS